jgi:hypothetical protein
MKQKYKLLLALGLNLVITSAIAQTNQPPPMISDAFAKMFPTATSVDWKEKTNNFTAFFNLKDRKCETKFAKTGEWLNTEETIALDSLPQPIQDGFKTCKYADWKANSAYSVQSSDGTTQYHIVATRADLGRKILFFGPDGKLLADR